MMSSTTINSYLPLFLCLIAVGLTTVSCEGPTGPEGPSGPQGDQGDPGNANIMYSDWMDIEWDEEGSNNTIKQMPIRESLITEDFLNDGGFILMFIKVEGSSGVVLVYTLPLLTSGGNFQYRFATFAEEEIGGIVFLLQSLDDTAIPDYLWEDYQIRYVLIPGSENLAAKGVDWQSYDAVVKYSGIPE